LIEEEPECGVGGEAVESLRRWRVTHQSILLLFTNKGITPSKLVAKGRPDRDIWEAVES
jgi:hypothetical protein